MKKKRAARSGNKGKRMLDAKLAKGHFGRAMAHRMAGRDRDAEAHEQRAESLASRARRRSAFGMDALRSIASGIGTILAGGGGEEAQGPRAPRGGESPRHVPRERQGVPREEYEDYDPFHGIACAECKEQRNDRQKWCRVHGFVQCREVLGTAEGGRSVFCRNRATVRRPPCGHRVLCLDHYKWYDAHGRPALQCHACRVQVDAKAYHYEREWHYSAAASKLDKCCDLSCLYRDVPVHDR